MTDDSRGASELAEDVALYLQLEASHPVNAAAHFQNMMEKYPVRRMPQNRYDILPDTDAYRGTIIAPPQLDDLARERDRYDIGTAERTLINDTLGDLYHAGGTMDYDVYTDDTTVWIDDGETLKEVSSLSEALPLEEQMDTYDMTRGMGATGDAKEQFDRIFEQYAAGVVDPDQDILLLYDADTNTGYLFDTFEIDVRSVTVSLQDLLDELDYSSAPEVDFSTIFDQLDDTEEE